MKIVLSGGGTGGHIYPALALRQEILKKYPDAQFLYIGTEKGLENKIVTEQNIDFKAIKVQGIKRSLSLENLKTAYYLLTSIRESKKILKAFNPDIVIGTGGYVCGPVLYAASKMKIPTLIHEQNSVAGITNKILAKYVTKICTCFEAVNSDFQSYAQKIVFTGNPRGQELVNTKFNDNVLETLGLSKNIPTVLIFGGSRGALHLNETIVRHYDDLIKLDCQCIFVTGDVHYDNVINTLGKTDKKFKVVPYLNNMTDVLRVVDLVVCRSGATTLAELTALGMPSILVPSPYVTNNHQEKNARALVERHAAELVLESELSDSTLYQKITSIMNDDEKRYTMGQEAKKMGVTDASHRIISIIEEILK